jgi:O-antigen/teichoic acid export membrane protein
MSKTKSRPFIYHTTMIMLNRVSVSFFSFLVTVMIARQLGAVALGSFSIVMGILAVFQFLSVMGYENIIIRDIAGHHKRSRQLMSNGAVLGIISSLICAGLMITIGKVFQYSEGIFRLICFSTLILLPNFLNTISETLLIGLKKPQVALYASAIRDVIWFGLSFWGIHHFKNIDCVVVAFFISRVVALFIYLYLFAREKIGLVARPQWKGLSYLQSFIFINIFSNVLMEIDIVILSKFASVAEVGFYSIAKKIIRVSFILLFSMTTASFPIISEAMGQGMEIVRSQFRMFSQRVLWISLALAIAIFGLSPFIIQIFFGKGYQPAIEIIHILIWRIIPLGLSFLWSRFLIAAHQQDRDVQALVMGFLIYVGVGIVLLKNYGYLGFAASDVIAITALALIHFLFVKDTLKNEQLVGRMA